MYLFVFVEVEWGMCGHRGACCAVTTEFLVGCFCVYFLNVGKWLAAPRVSHARLLPPLYRQRSSVCIYLYLSGWSGVCVGTGAHAARRQLFLFCGQLMHFYVMWVRGLSNRV